MMDPELLRRNSGSEIDPRGPEVAGPGNSQNDSHLDLNTLGGSESFFGNIIESMGDGLLILNRDFQCVYWNHAMDPFSQVPLTEYAGIKRFPWDVFPHIPKQEMLDMMQKVIQGGIVKKEDVLYDLPDGKRGNISVVLFPLRSLTDRIVGVVGVFRDVTERKRAQEQLQESEERYRSLFENNHAVMLLVDPATADIVDANPAACSFYGFGKDELTLKKITDLNVFTPEDIFGVIKNPESDKERQFYFCQHIVRGEVRDVEVYSGPIRVPNRNLLYLIVHDVTERKKVERELRSSREQFSSLAAHLQSVREDERTRIAREIHDDLGQLLTALSIDLSWIKRRIPEDAEKLITKINLMLSLVDQADETLHRLVAELRPSILDDLGLLPAIEWLSQDFSRRSGIEVALSLDSDIYFTQEQSTAVFRILQESLTNIARHANASHVVISLQVKASKVVLEVRDDGRGIAEKQILHPRSFGLIGIRERAESLQGKFKIDGIPGQGTIVQVSIPYQVQEDKS